MFSSYDVSCEVCGNLITSSCVVMDGEPKVEGLCAGCEKAVKDAQEQRTYLINQKKNENC